MNGTGAGKAGFTLIEVLIAMAIFALISAMTFQGLQSSMSVQERVEKKSSELRDLQLVMTLMLQDFMNLVRRPVRTAFGNEFEPAFVAGDGAGSAEGAENVYTCQVFFTRAGLRASGLGAGMQRVAYCLDPDFRLYRLAWAALDRAQDSVPVESLLLENVVAFNVAPEWSEEGHSPDDFAEDAPEILELMPQSIVVAIELDDGISYVRRFPGLGIYPWIEEQ